MFYRKYIKSFLDRFIACIILIISSPILIISILGLSISNQSIKVLFKQERPGLNGKLFILYKLKTMKDKDSSLSKQLKDSERITYLGRFIRKLSIDELPQLFNVIKGDMSLIGPRPLLPEYLEYYNLEQAKRHDVKPGITGWAQVNGRNSMTFNARLEHDVWYVKNMSFILDFMIFCRTLLLVFKSSNIIEDDPNNFFNQIGNQDNISNQ